MRRWNLVVISLLLAVPMLAQNISAAHVPTAPILLGADLPTYPPVWRVAHLTGKVVVLVTVKDGRVVDTRVKSGEIHLQVPTVANLKTWRFAKTVSRQFMVSYTYKISGTPTNGPTNPKVEILPLLNVIITARPVRPTCSDCKAPPMKVLSPK